VKNHVFPQFSKDAFRLLKNVFKYNSSEKRDGSIANRVIEGEQIIYEEAEINKLLVESLKLIQWDAERPLYERQTQYHFPYCQNLQLKK